MQPILMQAIERLGYGWNYVEDLRKRTIASIQYCVRFRQNRVISSPTLGFIFGVPCLRRCEARESVLVRALHYIDNDRSYIIRDMHYWQWRHAKVAVLVLSRFICIVMFN